MWGVTDIPVFVNSYDIFCKDIYYFDYEISVSSVAVMYFINGW